MNNYIFFNENNKLNYINQISIKSLKINENININNNLVSINNINEELITDNIISNNVNVNENLNINHILTSKNIYTNNLHIKNNNNISINNNLNIKDTLYYYNNNQINNNIISNNYLYIKSNSTFIDNKSIDQIITQKQNSFSTSFIKSELSDLSNHLSLNKKNIILKSKPPIFFIDNKSCIKAKPLNFNINTINYYYNSNSNNIADINNLNLNINNNLNINANFNTIFPLNNSIEINLTNRLDSGNSYADHLITTNESYNLISKEWSFTLEKNKNKFEYDDFLLQSTTPQSLLNLILNAKITYKNTNHQTINNDLSITVHEPNLPFLVSFKINDNIIPYPFDDTQYLIYKTPLTIEANINSSIYNINIPSINNPNNMLSIRDSITDERDFNNHYKVLTFNIQNIDDYDYQDLYETNNDIGYNDFKPILDFNFEYERNHNLTTLFNYNLHTDIFTPNVFGTLNYIRLDNQNFDNSLGKSHNKSHITSVINQIDDNSNYDLSYRLFNNNDDNYSQLPFDIQANINVDINFDVEVKYGYSFNKIESTDAGTNYHSSEWQSLLHNTDFKTNSSKINVNYKDKEQDNFVCNINISLLDRGIIEYNKYKLYEEKLINSPIIDEHTNPIMDDLHDIASDIYNWSNREDLLFRFKVGDNIIKVPEDNTGGNNDAIYSMKVNSKLEYNSQLLYSWIKFSKFSRPTHTSIVSTETILDSTEIVLRGLYLNEQDYIDLDRIKDDYSDLQNLFNQNIHYNSNIIQTYNQINTVNGEYEKQIPSLELQEQEVYIIESNLINMDDSKNIIDSQYHININGSIINSNNYIYSNLFNINVSFSTQLDFTKSIIEINRLEENEYHQKSLSDNPIENLDITYLINPSRYYKIPLQLIYTPPLNAFYYKGEFTNDILFEVNLSSGNTVDLNLSDKLFEQFDNRIKMYTKSSTINFSNTGIRIRRTSHNQYQYYSLHHTYILFPFEESTFIKFKFIHDTSGNGYGNNYNFELLCYLNQNSNYLNERLDHSQESFYNDLINSEEDTLTETFSIEMFTYDTNTQTIDNQTNNINVEDNDVNIEYTFIVNFQLNYSVDLLFQQINNKLELDIDDINLNSSYNKYNLCFGIDNQLFISGFSDTSDIISSIYLLNFKKKLYKKKIFNMFTEKNYTRLYNLTIKEQCENYKKYGLPEDIVFTDTNNYKLGYKLITSGDGKFLLMISERIDNSGNYNGPLLFIFIYLQKKWQQLKFYNGNTSTTYNSNNAYDYTTIHNNYINSTLCITNSHYTISYMIDPVDSTTNTEKIEYDIYFIELEIIESEFIGSSYNNILEYTRDYSLYINNTDYLGRSIPRLLIYNCNQLNEENIQNGQMYVGHTKILKLIVDDTIEFKSMYLINFSVGNYYIMPFLDYPHRNNTKINNYVSALDNLNSMWVGPETYKKNIILSYVNTSDSLQKLKIRVYETNQSEFSTQVTDYTPYSDISSEDTLKQSDDREVAVTVKAEFDYDATNNNKLLFDSSFNGVLTLVASKKKIILINNYTSYSTNGQSDKRSWDWFYIYDIILEFCKTDITNEMLNASNELEDNYEITSISMKAYPSEELDTNLFFHVAHISYYIAFTYREISTNNSYLIILKYQFQQPNDESNLQRLSETDIMDNTKYYHCELIDWNEPIIEFNKWEISDYYDPYDSSYDGTSYPNKPNTNHYLSITATTGSNKGKIKIIDLNSITFLEKNTIVGD